MNEEEMEQKFQDWFTDNLTPYTFRCEWAYGDIVTDDIKTREENMKNWMKSAYYAGYERAQYDMLEEELNEN